MILAESEGLEPPQACARRFSRPLQYHYASSPGITNFALKYKKICTNDPQDCNYMEIFKFYKGISAYSTILFALVKNSAFSINSFVNFR